MHTFLNVTPKDLKFLLAQGFGTEAVKTQYEAARYKGPCTVVLYTSGKAVLSGKDAPVKAVMKQLLENGAEMVDKISFVPQSGWFIGSDESLKGDTFGGLTVAGVKADDAGRNALRLIGVEDSKKVTDANVMDMADQIKRKVKYHIISIPPSEYNTKTQTALLNELHLECALQLGSGTHVVDKYPGCRVGDIATTKAEQKYLEVAAASILARAAGLEQFEKMSKELGFNVPKGSTHVADALVALKESGKDPSNYVKRHFNNVQKVFG